MTGTARDDLGTPAFVTGFGCRPIANLSTRTAGPAFESRQGTKSRASGHPTVQRALWGIGWRGRCSRMPVGRASLPDSASVGRSKAKPATMQAGSRSEQGPFHSGMVHSSRAGSVPAVDQQHNRAAVMVERVVSVMRCRSSSRASSAWSGDGVACSRPQTSR